MPHKMFSLSGALMAAAAIPLWLAACAAPARSENVITVSEGVEFQLQPEQTARLPDDSSLRYVRLVKDARCPPNVQCVWAGDAIVALEWWKGAAEPERFELHTGLEPRAHALGGRSLKLRSLERGEAPAASFLLGPGGQ